MNYTHLTIEERCCLREYYLQGKSYREIAKLHSLPCFRSILKSYTDLINAHIIPAFGDKHLDEITRAEIQNYLSNLADEEKYRTTEPKNSKYNLKLYLTLPFQIIILNRLWRKSKLLNTKLKRETHYRCQKKRLS